MTGAEFGRLNKQIEPLRFGSKFNFPGEFCRDYKRHYFQCISWKYNIPLRVLYILCKNLFSKGVEHDRSGHNDR